VLNIETFTGYYNQLQEKFINKEDYKQLKQTITNDVFANGQRINNLDTKIENSATAIATHHQTKFLALDGSNKMNTNLNLGGFRVVNASQPQGIHDLATVHYVNSNVKKQMICITDRFYGGGKGWLYNNKNTSGVPLAYKGKILKLSICAKNQNIEMETAIVLNNATTNHKVFKPAGYKTITAIFDEPLQLNKNDCISFTNHHSLQPHTYLSLWIEIELD